MDESVRLQGSLRPDPALLGFFGGLRRFLGGLRGVGPSFAEEALGRMSFRAVRDG